MSLDYSSSTGTVEGPGGVHETLVCQYLHRTSSQGTLWSGRDPFGFTVPVLLSQLVIIISVSNTIWIIFRPLKQGHTSAQLLAGIILGQSFIGRIPGYTNELFPPGGIYMLETFADIGLLYYLFILGVQIDLRLVKKLQRSAVTIGILGYIIPYVFGIFAVVIGVKKVGKNIAVPAKRCLPFVTTMNSVSSFPVITSLLTDLNLLSTDIGRIAALSSFVSDICHYLFAIIITSVLLVLSSGSMSGLIPSISLITFMLFILFVLRPLLIKISGVDREMKESKFIVITVLVMICGLLGQIIGMPASLSTFILGVVIPDEVAVPFLHKLDIINNGMLVPAKFALIGMQVKISSIKPVSGMVTEFVILVNYSAKFTVVFLLGLRYGIPTTNAFALSLIMNCKGVIEAAMYVSLLEGGGLTDEAFALLIISMLVVTGIARPLIGKFYNPSAKYQSRIKKCILNSLPNEEMRMVVCLHSAEGVPMLINLLDVSTTLPDRTFEVFILNLVEMKGKGASVLEKISDKGGKLVSSSKSWSTQAAKIFDQFVERHQDTVYVRHYTSISPYSSMHDDICSLALDKEANIVIVPFHKQWTVDGEGGATSTPIRIVNHRVLCDSPCSVGILVDRGILSNNHSLVQGQAMYEITALFLGGGDDCEALAYCTRFVDNPQIRLTVVWIRPSEDDAYGQDEAEVEMLEQFRERTRGNERISVREEPVKDAIGTTRVIRSIDKQGCDLCIVGNHHEPQSSLVHGLTDWNEFPELGLIGGMLASSDFRFSVVVVQKEYVAKEMPQMMSGSYRSSSSRRSTRTSSFGRE